MAVEDKTLPLDDGLPPSPSPEEPVDLSSNDKVPKPNW